MRYILIGSVLLVLATLCMGTDKIGNWPFDNDPQKGQRSGSGPYINLFGLTDAPGTFGAKPAMATLVFWNSASLWTIDSLANDSSGTLQLSDWLGKGAVVKWTYSSASAANLGEFTLTWQTKYSDYDSWVTAKTLIDGDSITEGTFIDSIDFSDPALSAPYHRLYLDGDTLSGENPSDGVFSALVKVFHTPAVKDY